MRKIRLRTSKKIATSCVLRRYGVVLFCCLSLLSVRGLWASPPPSLGAITRAMEAILIEQHILFPSQPSLNILSDSIEEEEGKGVISAYDHLFIKEAKRIGWDWWYLAAIAYHESKFQPHVGGGRAVAIGLMGILPSTGRRFGASASQLRDAATSVRVAASCLDAFAKEFNHVSTSRDRELFALASYVCGSGHVHDACRIAQKHGANSLVWDEVKSFILKMNQPKYYRDKLVRFGRFNGKHTVKCVSDIDVLAQKYAQQIAQAKSKK